MPEIRRRLIVLASISIVGSVAFMPFLAAATHARAGSLLSVALVVGIVSTLIAWPGLYCADATNLPMPLLRRLDGRRDAMPAFAFQAALGVAALFGFVGIVLLRILNAPSAPGSAMARALSALFAGGPIEIIVHVGLMSILVWVMNGRAFAPIALTAMLYGGLHVAMQSRGDSLGVSIAVFAVNGGLAFFLGLMYALYGIEFAMVSHAMAHLLTLLFGA
jgi:hypothetical protein